MKEASINTPATWRDYLTLCKPRVVLLMVLTSVIGMALATPVWLLSAVFWWGNIGIALAAGAAAAINHLADHRIDSIMRRTQHRPMVQGKINTRQTLVFATVLCFLSMFVLVYFVNVLTAILTFCSIIGYAGVYTLYLKHATSQNIVIGGVAGAAPPLLGWVAVTGHVDYQALLLMLIIFVWTPPHFWALAIARVEDYRKADVPMLPITHGIRYTKWCILLYTVLLVAVTILPYVTRMCGWVYLILALLLNARFVHWVIRLWRSQDNHEAMSVFRYSIIYLMWLFLALLADHYLPTLVSLL